MVIDTQTVNVETLLANAGNFQLDGNFQSAIECYQSALKIEPMNADIYDALGLTMLRMGEDKIATELFKTSTTLNPESSDSFRYLGLAYYALNNKSDAIKAFNSSIAINPDNIDALIHLGQMFFYSENYQKAIKFFTQAHTIDENNPEPLCELSEIYLKQSKLDAAIETALAALKLRRDSIKALRSLTIAYRIKSENTLSTIYAFELIRIDPGESQNYVELVVSLFFQGGGSNIGMKYAEKAIELNPDNPEAHYAMAIVLFRLGDWDRAIVSIDRALKMAPDNEIYIGQKADLLHHLGRNKEAYELALPLVSNRTTFNYYSLGVLSRIAGDYGKEAEIVNLLDKALANKNLEPVVRSQLSFSAGELHDKLGQYNKAFSCIDDGNKLRNIKSNIEVTAQLVTEIKQQFSKAFFNQAPRAESPSNKPIFIIGMPRSGTSLTEKILASHSQVFGANELNEIQSISHDLPKVTASSQKAFPACVVDLTPEHLENMAQRYLDFIHELDPGNHARITDKMPQNFLYIGIIALLYPESPIIHCVRDPMDTCLSCYFQNFTAGSGGMAFTFDLTSLGQYYRLYEGMMAHWNRVLPGRIYDIHYESLVSNPQLEIEKLLQHCKLEWEKACMEHDKSTHITTTASYDQVRQPINTKSVERWRRYEKQLAPLRAALENE